MANSCDRPWVRALHFRERVVEPPGMGLSHDICQVPCALILWMSDTNVVLVPCPRVGT